MASRYTSYIAVDTAENKVLKESWMLMKTRDVPLEVARGYGGWTMTDGGGVSLSGVPCSTTVLAGSSMQQPVQQFGMSASSGRPFAGVFSPCSAGPQRRTARRSSIEFDGIRRSPYKTDGMPATQLFSAPVHASGSSFTFPASST